MNELIEERYFSWLCAKVEDARNSRSRKILQVLFHTEFVPLPEITGDDNRAEDGKELRRQFIIEADIPDDPEWRLDTGCSVFEMLIALARRAEFVTDDSAKVWFWELIDNLGLRGKVSPLSQAEVEEILYRLIWRRYDDSGFLSIPILFVDGKGISPARRQRTPFDHSAVGAGGSVFLLLKAL